MPEKEEIGTAETAPISTPKETTDDSVAFSMEDVKYCLALSTLLKEMEPTSKEIASVIRDVFPNFNRQLLSQAANWERYGVILHPDALKHLCAVYDVTEKPKPKHAQPRRKKTRHLTLRVTDTVYSEMVRTMGEMKISTVQTFLEYAVRCLIDGKEIHGN